MTPPRGKVSAIGSVNPRRPSLLNNLAQRVKRLIARLLHWHVRDQVDFNRAVVRYLDRSLEAQTTQNQNLLKVAQSLAELQRDRSTAENQFPELKMQVDDLTRHWNEWRPAWEGKLADSEIQILHGMREIEAGARDREESFRQSLQQMHSDYLIALSRAAEETQNKVSKGP